MLTIRPFRPFVVLFFSVVVGCAALQPKSFDQSLALAYAYQTSVLETATMLLQRKQISKEDATTVMAISDEAGWALDKARENKDRDTSTAQASLELAIDILDQLDEYLQKRANQ